MKFHLADTFTAALGKLQNKEQKAVKSAVFDMQMSPEGHGLQMHRIDKSKDDAFWSARVSRDIRLIIHKRGGSLLVAYVDHHDKAYAWAERRRIEAHPKTGAIQIVEVRERVEEIAPPEQFDFVMPEPVPALEPSAPSPVRHFTALDDTQLLSIGVPEDWTSDVRAASEDGFFALADHLPAEAAEALLEYADTGKLPEPVTAIFTDPYNHPDALRRIRPIADSEELELALAFPWEKWGVFLHPSQRDIVERDYTGPARVAGSAGTGKTVVALHRAVRLAREKPEAKILLASFSNPLAVAIQNKIKVLAPETGSIVPRITTASFEGIAEQLYQLEYGVRPRIASERVLRDRIGSAARKLEIKGFSDRFLLSEWLNVIDAWNVCDTESYLTIARMGRKSRLGPKQRERLWPIFETVRNDLVKEGYTTWSSVFTQLADTIAAKMVKPFDHIVIDEAQDLGPAELRFFAAIAPKEDNALFLAGDLGQRIFQHPYSWKSLGVDVRGRSHTLKICYRTSQQIRQSADRLLPSVLQDVDGHEDERSGTQSVFEGPLPEIFTFESESAESEAVADFIQKALADGIEPIEIGVIIRASGLVERAKIAVANASIEVDISIINMHLAKGLEFRAVVIMACDEGILPLDDRIADAADEAELDDIYETERRLLYVACTRARDRLFISGVKPSSEFLTDLIGS